MKKCVIISNYVNNEYRKSLLKEKIELFNSHNIDVILASSDPMDRYEGVKNYITNNHVCESHYLTQGYYPYFCANNMRFLRNLNNNKVLYSNYYITLYKIITHYCKNLGYDFLYFIDLDVLINKDHYNFIFNEIDTSKSYFYTLGSNNSFQVTFFYGNIDILKSLFTDEKLNYIEWLAKRETKISNEEIVYILANQHKDIIAINLPEDDIFERRNLFSSSNQSEIYFDSTHNRYIFLFAKGDYCKNTFSTELFEENTLIYSGTLTNYCEFHIVYLKDNTNYTIKYYDNMISESTLSKVKHVFTESGKSATPNNWIEHF